MSALRMLIFVLVFAFSTSLFAAEGRPFHFGILGGYDFGTTYSTSDLSTTYTFNTTGTWDAGVRGEYLPMKGLGAIVNAYWEGQRNLTSYTQTCCGSGATSNLTGTQPNLSSIVGEVNIAFAFEIPYIFAGGNYNSPTYSNGTPALFTSPSVTGGWGYQGGAGVMFKDHFRVEALYRYATMGLTTSSVAWDYWRESSVLARAAIVY